VLMIKSIGPTRPPLKAAIAAAFGVGLLLCAGVGSAEAAKVTRDHRAPSTAGLPGGVKVTPRPGGPISAQTIARRKTIRCSGSHWSGDPAACRDHRAKNQ
jgi:hypothetical protein